MKKQITNNKKQIYSIKIILLPLCLCIYFSFFGVPTVRAQNVAFSVSPPITEILIKPSKSITKDIKIINQGSDISLTPQLVELTARGINETGDFTPDPWIAILDPSIRFQTPFILQAGEEKTIKISIAPTSATEEKDYYRVILFSTNPILQNSHSNAAIQQRIGSIFLISVSSSGRLTKSMEITSFDLPFFIDSFSAIKANIHVKNSGTTYIRPNGSMKLEGIIGRATFPILPRLVYPGDSIALSSSGNLDNTVTIPGFFFGRYDLSADLIIDESKITLSQKKTLYAFPWKLTVILAMIVGIFMLWKKGKLLPLLSSLASRIPFVQRDKNISYK